jgi:hypothetical protein
MPSDYQGEVELDIDDDSMTPMSKADKRDAMNALIQNILLLQKAGITQAGIFNPHRTCLATTSLKSPTT